MMLICGLEVALLQLYIYFLTIYHHIIFHGWTTRVWFPARQGFFSSSPPRSNRLTIHLNLMARLRMRRAIPQLLHTFSWRGA